MDTATTTPAQQLYNLPEPIQEQLVRIARIAAGMSTEEKAAARLTFGTTGLHFAMYGDDDTIPGADLVATCGVIVALVDENSGSNASWMVV